MNKRTVYALAAALAIFLSGCAAEKPAPPALLTPVGAMMDTAVCAAGDMEDVAIHEAAVAPRIAALHFTRESRIGAIPVQVGDWVEPGDHLVQIDVSAINGALSALAAEEAQISGSAEYEKALWDIDMEIAALELSKLKDANARYDKETEIALLELERQNAEAAWAERLSAIRAEGAALEAQLGDTWLTAPYAGRVVAIACAPGQTVKAYDTICVLTNDSELLLQSDYISPAALADAAAYYALIGGVRYEIVPEPVDEDEYARAALRGIKYLSSYQIKGDVLNPGDTGAVVLVTARRENVLKIPVNALFEDGDARYVYAVEGESRVRRDVETGLMTSTEAEILSGLAEGEVVYVGD